MMHNLLTRVGLQRSSTHCCLLTSRLDRLFWHRCGWWEQITGVLISSLILTVRRSIPLSAPRPLVTVGVALETAEEDDW